MQRDEQETQRKAAPDMFHNNTPERIPQLAGHRNVKIRAALIR